MTDAAALELRLVRQEMAELRRMLDHLVQQRDQLTPAQRITLRTVVRLYAAGEAFTTGSALDAARFDADARAALKRACGLDAQRLGIQLRQIADDGAQHAGVRLVALPPEAGVRRWTLEPVESL